MVTYSLLCVLMQLMHLIVAILFGADHRVTTWFWWLVFFTHLLDQARHIFGDDELALQALAADVRRRLVEINQFSDRLEERMILVDRRIAELTQAIETTKLTRLALEQLLQSLQDHLPTPHDHPPPQDINEQPQPPQ